MTAQPTATGQPGAAAAYRERGIERWRRRSRIIRVLRVLGPSLIALIVLGLIASVALNAMRPSVEPVQEANQPIRLLNPHFVGRDERGRAFTLTAASATRDPQEYQKVYLDKPAMVLDDQGPDPTRIIAKAGVFHEQTGRLDVSGGVRVASASGVLETAASQYDTKSGALTGSGPVHGSGALGEIDAKSYSVTDKGDHLVFQGRVHSRFFPKK